MADLDVVAIMKAKSGSEQMVRDTLVELAAATRGEAGCVSYHLYESKAVATSFFTVEKWDSQASLDAHMKTDHIAHALSVVSPHLEVAPDIHPLTPIG